MKESLIIGLALGLIAGAVIATSNNKARDIIEKGKDEVKKQVAKM